MNKTKLVVALALLAAATSARSEVSSTWTLTNDYDFRGVSQSAADPALQASIDYANESGWYVGAWASNVDFGDDTDYEIDVYAGFSFGDEDAFLYDVGLVYYTYEDSDLNYPEIYAGVAYDWAEAKIWYSNDFGASDEGALYLELNGTFPIGESGFSGLAHAGYSTGDGIEVYGGDDSYFDWSLGVGYSAGNFDLALKYVDGSDLEALDGTPDDVFTSEGRFVLTISTTFPWASE